MTRCPPLIAALLLALGLAACADDPAAARARRGGPDVVLVVVDTLRADHLASLGHELPTDAPLARFLDQATLFENCWAPAPWTLPSTASILSGLHPLRHRAFAHGDRLGDDALTLAESLAAGGWRTLGLSHNHNVGELTGFAQGFERFETFGGRAVAYPDASELVSTALDWLDESPARTFLYLQPMNVHGPYKVPEPHRDDLLGRAPTPGFAYYGKRMAGILREGRVEWRDNVRPEYLRSLEEQYDTAVRYTLAQVAELFEQLDRRGRFDDALVILTADHGEELFEHGGFSHGYGLHRETLHVPLMIKLPGQRTPLRRDEHVSLTDVAPTLLELLALPAPVDGDGRSLAGRLRPDPEPLPDGDRALLFHVDWKKRCVGRALQWGRWKLVDLEHDYSGRGATRLLYDLANDPREEHDLASAHPELVRRLEERLRGEAEALGARSLAPAENVLAEMDEATLRALGYL